MKFPSIYQLQEDSLRAAKRFPLSLISAFLGSVLLIYLIEIDQIDQQLQLVNLLLTFALGVPLFFCVDIFVEKQKSNSQKRLIGWGIVILILLLIYFSFPKENTFSTTRIPYIRYVIYNLTAHLLVAFLSYWNDKSEVEFWKFNENLFLRIVLGAFYSFAIFLGSTLALIAINELFSLEINPKIFFYIFVSTVGIFNTWFFLAGAPRNLNEEISLEIYPTGLKIFTQFILIPLLLVYLTILYFYGGKIILTWDWPKGIVSYMIIAISVLGIFTNLLLFPIQDQKESSWVKTFYRAFYFLLIPLIVLLFFAIGIRIQEYGLTVNRYLILLMGIWLTFIVTYFIFGPGKIKTIPISLAVFMILSSFGPWGMFGLSKLNQINRLIFVLEENDLLVDGKILNETQWEVSEKGAIIPIKKGKETNLDQKSLKEVNSIIQYLEDYHGLEDLEPWYDQDLKSILETSAENSKSKKATLELDELFIKSIGLDYIPSYELEYDPEETKQLNFIAIGEFRYSIEEFEELIKFDASRYSSPKSEENDFAIYLDKEGESMLVIISNGREIRVDLEQFILELQLIHSNSYETVEWDDLTFEYNSEDLALVLFFENIDARSQDGELIIESLNGFVLIGKQDLTNEKP